VLAPGIEQQRVANQSNRKALQEQGISVVKASRITLGSGREVSLCQLTQELTYAGLLEGVPNRKLNKMQVDGLVAKWRKLQPVHLVPPVETPIEWRQPWPFGSEPAKLPTVTCIGRFWSDTFITGDHPTTLTIIWFQNEFAMPIDPAVLAKIIGLHWDALATACD
jgi:hypothetical protein